MVHPKQEAQLCMLDLYAGAGAMSTGLEMGGPLAGVNIWTVQISTAPCEGRYLWGT